MSLQETAKRFIADYESQKYDSALALLPEIKLSLAKSGLIVPDRRAKKYQSDYQAARQVLEIGVLVAIHAGDEDEINRLIPQLRPFYAKSLGLPASANENKIHALYLLLLLSKNEIAEFHTELEGLQGTETDQFLSYPVRLERWLMEGSYDKVWSAITQQSQVPAPEFAILAQALVYTIRSEIAASAQHSYSSLPVSNARHLLFLQSDQELAEFVGQQEGWSVKNGRIYFQPDDTATAPAAALPVPEEKDEPAEKLIGNALTYAREIETII